MKNLIFSLLAFLVLPLQAQDAKEIVRKSDEQLRGKSSSFTELEMRIIRPKWKRSVGIKSWSKGDDYALILITAPARDKGQSFLKRGNEMWNWQPTISRTIKLPPSMMGQSWMGSDFTNDDLVKQASIVSDYTHKILGSETISTYDCYKILLKPKPNAAVIWDKVELWISKKGYLQMQSKMYDEDGYLVNTMKASQVKTLGGRLIPTYQEMIPADKAGHKTVLIYKLAKFDMAISEGYFSTQNMKRVK